MHGIVSAGYMNRYRHPHAEVLASLGAAGITLWRTDTQGAVQLKLGQDVQLATLRQGWQPYWVAR
jgi:competence protein ComEC